MYAGNGILPGRIQYTILCVTGVCGLYLTGVMFITNHLSNNITPSKYMRHTFPMYNTHTMYMC